MTEYQAHVAAWKDCRRCPLGGQRDRICLARGRVPCDVLFVGEAPGPSEDAIGQPFVGPAGGLLDQIIAQVVCLTGKVGEVLSEAGDQVIVACTLRFAFTNLVTCFPRKAKREGSNEPTDAEVEACQPRLAEFVALARPRLVVAVGTLARDWLDPKRRGALRLPAGVRQIEITHPAAILRASVAQQGLLIQRCVVRIANAVREMQ